MSEKPQPITHKRNRELKGHGLCAEVLYRQHVDQVEAARTQQAAYLASLPTDPAEAIEAAEKILQLDPEGYPADFMVAMHFSVALRALVDAAQPMDFEERRSTAIHIADGLVDALRGVARDLDLVSDILSGPVGAKRKFYGR